MSKNHIEESNSCYIKIVLLGIIILWIANWVYCFYSEVDKGSFGDQFGAVNALFTGFAFAGTVYALILQRKSIDLQQKELEAQREELKQTRAEFKKQTEIFDNETKTQELQRFESTFFMLLTHLQKTVSVLHIECYDVYGNSIIANGKTCFEVWYMHKCRNDKNAGLRLLINSDGGSELLNSKNYEYLFDYFGYLCSILEYIDYGEKSNVISSDNRYVTILRNLLSRYELVAIFYYGLTPKGRESLKARLERYHLLCNIGISDLAESFKQDNRQKMTNFITENQPTGTDFDYYVTKTDYNEECYHESAFVKPDNYDIPHFEVSESE